MSKIIIAYRTDLSRLSMKEKQTDNSQIRLFPEITGYKAGVLCSAFPAPMHCLATRIYSITQKNKKENRLLR